MAYFGGICYECYHKFNEAGNLTYTGHWFDAQHRYGEKFALEYDDSGRMRKGILIKMIWNNVERLKV